MRGLIVNDQSDLRQTNHTMSGRIFVMGDIHGNLHALIQCMERSGFDIEKDFLIQLGDVSDRFPDTAPVVEYLLSIENRILIRGTLGRGAYLFCADTTATFLMVLFDLNWLGGRKIVHAFMQKIHSTDF